MRVIDTIRKIARPIRCTIDSFSRKTPACGKVTFYVLIECEVANAVQRVHQIESDHHRSKIAPSAPHQLRQQKKTEHADDESGADDPRLNEEGVLASIVRSMARR